MKMPRRLWLELTCLNEHISPEVTRDPQLSAVSWNIIRRHSEKASSTRIGDHKILLGKLVVGTADSVHDIVRDTAIDGVLLAGQDGGRQTQRSSN